MRICWIGGCDDKTGHWTFMKNHMVAKHTIGERCKGPDDEKERYKRGNLVKSCYTGCCEYNKIANKST